eukprot:3227888-Amphidinium_carterae.1
MPVFKSLEMELSETLHLEPKLLAFRVSVSFVCESNAGLTMRLFTKMERCERTWKGLMFIPPLFFALAFAWTASTN